MARFKWKGKDNTGKSISGVISANNPEEVGRFLSEKGITGASVSKAGASLELKIPGFGGPKQIPIKNIVIFVRQFVTMLEAGLPIIQSMDILIEQQELKAFKKVLENVKALVEGGSTLADALRAHPNAFDNLFCNLVDAGETGGVLDTVLSRLATYYEKQEAIKKKVKGALTYPLITLAIASGAVAIMLLKVIPVFKKMFADMGAELPGATQFVINLSEGLQANFWLIIGTIIAIVVIFKTLNKVEKTAYYMDMIALKLPLFGNIIIKGAMARFTQTMATLLSSGVPIVDALKIGEKIAGNRIIAEEIHASTEAITEGKTFTEPLKSSKIFPSMAVQMIEVGEATGQLDSMLEKVSTFFEEEVDSAVEGLTAAIEPIMMVFLGGIVGTLLIAMYMPIFSVAGNVKS